MSLHHMFFIYRLQYYTKKKNLDEVGINGVEWDGLIKTRTYSKSNQHQNMKNHVCSKQKIHYQICPIKGASETGQPLNPTHQPFEAWFGSDPLLPCSCPVDELDGLNPLPNAGARQAQPEPSML